jgi:lysophospholipase L1-like esterase
MEKIQGFLLRFVVLIVLMECLSWLGLKALDYITPNTEILPRTPDIFADQDRVLRELLRNQQNGRVVIDPVLGWRYRSGYVSSDDQINMQGLRSEREYSKLPDPGLVRVVAYGDSFTYGTEVSNSESWPAQMEQGFPHLEVLNYGVPGFGTDQAYLRYAQEGRELSPRVVLIGFAPVDLRRVVNVYRRFISTTELPLVKPRFVLTRGRTLELVPPPFQSGDDYERLLTEPDLVTTLGRHDYWYAASVYENPAYDWSATVRLLTNVWLQLEQKLISPDRMLKGGFFNARSEAFQIQTAILEEFHADVLAAGLTPLIVVLPGRDDVERAAAGDAPTYQPLIEYLAQRELDYIDCVTALLSSSADESIERLFAPGGHYSAEGNRQIALSLGEKITREMSEGRTER